MLMPMRQRLFSILIAIGAAPLVLWFCILVWLGAGIFTPDTPITTVFGFLMLYGLLGLSFALLLGGPILGFCIIITAPPTWWALHKTGLKHPLIFTLVGAIEAAGAGLLMRQFEFFEMPLACPIVTGAMCGWIIWRLGYEQP